MINKYKVKLEARQFKSYSGNKRTDNTNLFAFLANAHYLKKTSSAIFPLTTACISHSTLYAGVDVHVPSVL